MPTDALVNQETTRAAVLDGFIRSGILIHWHMGRGPGARRTWSLTLADGTIWRVERGTLDAMVAIANVALKGAA